MRCCSNQAVMQCTAEKEKKSYIKKLNSEMFVELCVLIKKRTKEKTEENSGFGEVR